jgi:hypothetical protein
MKKALLLTFIILLLIGVAVLLFALRSAPSIRVRVLDAAGEPVPGATLKPYALRGSSGGHYGWRSNSPVPPKTVQSDAKGIARIEYPTYIVEGIRSTEVTFTVEHPKFSSDTPSVPVPAPLPSSAPILARLTHLRDRLRHEGAMQTITLRPGATVEISAYLPEETNSVSNIFAKVSSDSGAFYPRYWSREGSLLLTHQMPPSDILLQAVHFTSNNLTYFSEVQSFKAEAGKTNHINLPLHPGIRLSGRLDSSVPRPVQHGLVNLRAVTLRKSSSNPLVWSDYSEVLPDGRFEFKSIPTGRIELLALCDGFISSNPTNARSMSQPQVFNLTNSSEISLSMNPVSIAEIKVIDTSGSPIPGADVAFWPNERWAEWSATILGTDFIRDADILRDPSDEAWRKYSRSIRNFVSKTDSNGIARVGELPAVRQPFSVSHENYETPINRDNERSDSMDLLPGRTNYALIKLQKKGRQVLE